MDIQISLKRLLLTALISASVITVPGISQAHKQGYYGDRNVHYYNRDYDSHNYKHAKHVSRHKYDKHRKYRGHQYDKHRAHDHGRYYSSNKHYIPRHTLASHRKELYLYWYD